MVILKGHPPHSQYIPLGKNDSALLVDRNKEGRSRGTVRDPASLKHRQGEGKIAADGVLNIGI